MGFIPSNTPQDLSITSQKLAPGAVTSDKLATGILDQAEKVGEDAAVMAVGADSATAHYMKNAVADKFTQAAGHDSTVNTSSTSSIFDNTNKKYDGADTADVQVLNGAEPSLLGVGESTSSGLKFVANAAGKIRGIVKNAACGATRAMLEDDAHNILASASFSGNTATFATPYTLTAGHTYFATVDKSGASYADCYQNFTSYPVDREELTITACYGGGAENTIITICISSLLYTTVHATQVFSAALNTLNGSISRVRLGLYGLIGSATWDLDVNGDGVYELTGQAVDTWITSAQTLAGAVARVNIGSGSSFKGWLVRKT